MKICGIYKITSPSKKVYIGQSVNILKRWNKYKNLTCERQNKLFASFQKHGVNKHRFEILCQCSREELNNLEIYYIELHQCFNTQHGLNLQNGGGKYIFSEESKNKMRLAKLGKKLSKEHKNKISKAGKGRKLTEYQRKRLLESNLGKKHTKERRDKISKSRLGKKYKN